MTLQKKFGASFGSDSCFVCEHCDIFPSPFLTLSYCPFNSKFLFPLLSGIQGAHPRVILLGLLKCPKCLQKVPAVPSKTSTFSKVNDTFSPITWIELVTEILSSGFLRVMKRILETD